jgi:hypothetical protein
LHEEKVIFMLRKLLAPAVIKMGVDDPNEKLYSPAIHPYRMEFTVRGTAEEGHFQPPGSGPVTLTAYGKSVEALEKYAENRRRTWSACFKEYKIFNPDGTVAVHVTD